MATVDVAPGLIENAAVEKAGHIHDGGNIMLAMSIAISLKRIADQLCTPVVPMKGAPSRSWQDGHD